MIEFNKIKKKFGEKIVLDGISGTLYNKKVNLVIGASGEGKSVLLKCLVGLINPDEGIVKYDGKIFSQINKEDQSEIRKKIGMLFQGGALFDSMTTEENVMFPLDMFTDLKRTDKLDIVNEFLEKVGLSGTNKKMISELSGGMRKRAGIARAIVNSPKYLFCDEPNSGLDPKTAIKIDELITNITYEKSITTVVVTHDTNSIISIGDNVIFIIKGKKGWEGSSEDIFNAKDESIKKFLFSGRLTQMLFSK